MTKWLVKDLSKLTGVSVQTLHHYDRIHLLKPSLRLPNGYRVYSEKDLLQLQQIIALRFFGFELAQIKTLLTDQDGALQHFESQAKVLEQKVETLSEATKTLNSVISEVKSKQSLPWETIIKLIEVYRMTQQLEHSWVKDIFTPEELKQYAVFESEWKKNSTPKQQLDFKQNWAQVVAEIHANLQNDPVSPLGIAIGKRCMTLINQVYGKKYAHLRNKKFEKGFAEGKGLDDVGLTPISVAWLEKAIDTYWRDRIYGILNRVGSDEPKEIIAQLWHEVLDDMYGEDQARKQEVYDAVLADKKTSPQVKAWLKTL